MRVVIVRDRESSGGGIVNYYKALAPHFSVNVRFCDVGKPHSFYSKEKSASRFTILRLIGDWLALLFTILLFRPKIVMLNPGLDVTSFRAMRRDAVSLMIARLLGRRVLVFWRGWHNSWCGKPEFPKGNRSLLSRTYRKASAHIVLSERFKEDLVRWGFTRPIHIETTVASDECLDASGGIANPDSGRADLLFLSRVEIAKGVFELIDAYLLVKKEFPNGTLTIAGDGPDLEALREYSPKAGAAGITFTGFVSGAEKVDCYRKATLFCFLSYTEGMPNAVLEAMAMGLPILSSDAGGLRDILHNGTTGTVMQADPNAAARRKFNPAKVAEAIIRLLRNTKEMGRIGKSNAMFARERFAASKVAARLEAIFRDVTSVAATPSHLPVSVGNAEQSN